MWLLATKAGSVLTPARIKETLCDPAESSQNLCYIIEETSEDFSCMMHKKTPKLPVWTKIHICSIVNAQDIPAEPPQSAQSTITWLQGYKHPFNLTELRTSFRTYFIP